MEVVLAKNLKNDEAEADPPQLVDHGFLAYLKFTVPNAPEGHGSEILVRLPLRPKVGDRLEVEPYSIRQRLSQPELHVTDWRVVDVWFYVNLDEQLANESNEDLPRAALQVTLHPMPAAG